MTQVTGARRSPSRVVSLEMENVYFTKRA